MRFAAIDPGKNAVGLSFWEDQELQLVVYIPVDDGLYVLSTTLRDMAPELVVCEIPQIYVAELQKGDQNDLIEVALVAGACLASAPKGIGVRPHTWKGSVPKPVHNRRVMNLLSPGEVTQVEAVTPASKRHNVVDAVGLGLWHLGRLRR